MTGAIVSENVSKTQNIIPDALSLCQTLLRREVMFSYSLMENEIGY
jgi:hypothetical protein